jgi:hypothetical protein
MKKISHSLFSIGRYVRNSRQIGRARFPSAKDFGPRENHSREQE